MTSRERVRHRSVPCVYHDFGIEVSLAEEVGDRVDPATVAFHHLSYRAYQRVHTHHLRVRFPPSPLCAP